MFHDLRIRGIAGRPYYVAAVVIAVGRAVVHRVRIQYDGKYHDGAYGPRRRGNAFADERRPYLRGRYRMTDGYVSIRAHYGYESAARELIDPDGGHVDPTHVTSEFPRL